MVFQERNKEWKFDDEEFIDRIFLDFEPLREKPGKDLQDEIDEFVDFIGWVPGKLYMCIFDFPWMYGDVENPEWMGKTLTKDDFIFSLEAEHPFLFLSVNIIKVKRCKTVSEWVIVIKALAGEHVCYAPLPLNTMSDDDKYHFSDIFMEAKLEEVEQEIIEATP